VETESVHLLIRWSCRARNALTCRRGELTAVCWSDVDPDRKKIALERSVTRSNESPNDLKEKRQKVTRSVNSRWTRTRSVSCERTVSHRSAMQGQIP
jgi:hypothetical protein